MYQPRGIKKIYHQIRKTLSHKWLSLFHPIQIGITGSYGKTATSQTLAKILANLRPTVVTDINLDTNFNVPITALKVRPWTKFVVWELGVDHCGEMDKHLEIAKPQIGIITGISPVHTDKEHLGSLTNLINEKRKLIEKLPHEGVAILNWDDEYVRAMAPFTKAKTLFYGTDKKNCHVFVDKKTVQVNLKQTSFKLSLRFNKKSIVIKTKLIGSHHIYTAMACFLVLKSIFNEEKKFTQVFQKTMSELLPLAGRVSVENGPLETLLLNDSLRANPKSTDAGLETFYRIPYKKGRKIAVLGVMGELQEPIKEHRKTAQALLKFSPDIVVGVGKYRRYTIDEAKRLAFPKERLFYCQNVFEAAELLKKILRKNDFLYLKASLLRNFRRILRLLDNKPICCSADICPYEHCR